MIQLGSSSEVKCLHLVKKLQIVIDLVKYKLTNKQKNLFIQLKEVSDEINENSIQHERKQLQKCHKSVVHVISSSDESENDDETKGDKKMLRGRSKMVSIKTII